MADLATLQVQLDALKAAYRSGIRTVEYDGRSTSYVSGEEMRAAIASLQSEIAQIMGTTTPTVGVVRSTKGY
ncbi:hypothetical protein ABIE85_008371 [Bradyrhizobium diazoefficiens]|jgi:hypothetical protein|uniref:phage head-tail joining protein n=1 Tax=Bradyrhizobium diazoefficiens TaxID=1355477 RepID=UPI00272D8D5B|nr:hypothetical protein [Bradyrhizobium diazoefficiens]WLA58540.1 hypothetical protein QIH81_07725 [Bradyrhizobium diazoefficiens]